MKAGQQLIILLISAVLLLLADVITCDVVGRDCHVIRTSCQQDPECATALEHIDDICEVKEGKCAASFSNIPTCARYMDVFRSEQFFGVEPCRCNPKSPNCTRMTESIYKNPCFLSVDYLRKYDQMPNPRTNTETTSTPQTTQQQQHKKKTRKFSFNLLRVIEEKTTKIPSEKVGATYSGVGHHSKLPNITKFEYVNNFLNHADKKKGANPEQYLALSLSLVILILLIVVAVVCYFVRRTAARKKKEDGSTKEPLVA